MRSAPFSLFSSRNLILLLLGLLTARSFAVSLGQLDSFSLGNQAVALRSDRSQEGPAALSNQDLLFNGWTREVGIDASLIPEGRSVTAEILDEHGLFVLSYGPGVSARTWLNYAAPEGLSLDLTMENAANYLGLLVEFSQAPFEVQISLESMGGFSSTHVFRQETSYGREQVEIPYEVFRGVDLERVTSLQVDILNIAGEGAPDIVISELSVRSDNDGGNSVPEPSSFLLGLLSTLVLCLRRHRGSL